VLESPDLNGVARLLTRDLPETLQVAPTTLLLWNRKLDSFEALYTGETQTHPLRPGEGAAVPETHYLLSDGQILETRGKKGSGTLLPLMARNGLAGMLVLGNRRGRRKVPFRKEEARLLCRLAARAALAIENHHYQKELIASERMAALGTMAGMLAHDFRGPMTVIRGYAEAIEEPGLPADEVRSNAGLIVKMIDRLEAMTRETLDFAKGGGRLVRRGGLLWRTLEELAKDVETELPGLEVVREIKIPAGFLASLDVDKLRRAVINIAANARDAMGGRGRFRMGAEIQEGTGRLLLTLSDEGPGVQDEIRETLFEPFVTRGKKGGTGLGLAVARRFVEDHGGTLELLSGGPGACFQLSLPLGEQRAEG